MNFLGTLSIFASLSFGVAILVLGYGLWAGQRGLGFRGMWLVLATLVVAQAVAVALLPRLASGETTLWRLSVVSLLALAFGFAPLLVAILQAGRIREAGRAPLS